MEGGALGPYLPEDISGLLGSVSPETLACTAGEYESGRPQWRKIGLMPELAGCIKREAIEPPERRPAAPARKKGPLLSLQVLSTDDDSGIRALLWSMLSDAGHSVEFAKDGEEVFERLAVKRYDLVILDVNMPKMNGYKVSELMHDKLPNPPKVIIFTGRDLEKERLQFVCSGADAILNKGTGNDKLIETIEELFAAKTAPPAQAEPEFVPEPQPAIIEEFSAAKKPVSIEKEEFYSSAPAPAPAPQAPVTPPARSVPLVQPISLTPAPVEPAVTKPVERPQQPQQPLVPQQLRQPPPQPEPPAVRYPAPAAVNNGKQDLLFSRLSLENKSMKADLVDIRRMLGHIELEYTQLEKQSEKQALKFLDENRVVSGKLTAEWRGLRNYVTLVALILLVTLAALFLWPR